MGIFEILFVAINIAIPIWLWTGTSKAKADIDWPTLEKNLARVIESDEGFPSCTTLRVVDIYHDLCAKSADDLRAGEVAVVERASKSIVFACGIEKDNINVNWRPENSENGELECGSPGGAVVALGPGFNFTRAGKIKSIEFWGRDQSRQRIPYRNCRLKATVAKKLATKSLSDFLLALGKAPGDPADFLDANMMCMVFDSSPLWRPWRERFM